MTITLGINPLPKNWKSRDRDTNTKSVLFVFAIILRARKTMQGCYLLEGEIQSKPGTSLFPFALRPFQGKHANSYKFCFFKALLDNIFNLDSKNEIAFSLVGSTFAAIYWNSVSVHKIPVQLNGISSVEKIISLFETSKPHMAGVPFDSLRDQDRLDYTKEILKIFPKYVVGAFYGDTEGMLYGFSKKQKKLWLNQISRDFLAEQKYLLEQLNYYEWLKYVESLLDREGRNIPNLSTILEDITKRTDLKPFKNELKARGEKLVCFYCGKALGHSFHLDHVIPWSYIQNDDLWNFVFACSSCNSSKNNQIPEQRFLDKLIDRNHDLIIPGPDINSVVEKAKMNGVKDGWKP